MKPRQKLPGTPVVIEHKGKVFQASFYVERGMITVSYGACKLAMQLDRIPAAMLARMMLREMVATNPGEVVAPLRLREWEL
jgi:hypothetical protein